MLLLVVAADYLLVGLVHLLFAADVFAPVVRATSGLVNRTLLGNAVLLCVVVGGLIFRRAGMRPRDVGLDRRGLPVGVAVFAGVWALVQTIQLISALLVDGTVRPAGEWSQPGAAALVSALIGQVLGNSLLEEIVYRGFLFPQLLLTLAGRWRGSRRRPFIAALLISQTLFAFRHLPAYIANGVGFADVPWDLLRLTGIGIMLALLYARTGNLFVVVGVHALFNAPTALFEPALIGPSLLALGLSVILLVMWPRPGPWAAGADVHAPVGRPR